MRNQRHSKDRLKSHLDGRIIRAHLKMAIGANSGAAIAPVACDRDLPAHVMNYSERFVRESHPLQFGQKMYRPCGICMRTHKRNFA